MARRTILNDELQRAIVERLAAGASILDTCRDVGISEAVFYKWTKRGREEKQRLEKKGTRAREAEKVYVEFVEATTRARGRAKMTAMTVVARGMFDTESTSETVETFSETRYRRGKDGEEIPYIYTRTTNKRTVTTHPPDWRLAIEYLKRRYRDEWSDKTMLDIENPQEKMVDLVRSGEITIEDLIANFGSLELVKEYLKDDILITRLLKESGYGISDGKDDSGGGSAQA